MSIALNHITLSYGSRTLLADVTAAFAQGSLTALIGRNGTGKSTLLRAIAGLGTTVSGDVELCGRRLASRTPHERATTVGFVTTDKVRIANLACEDVVALGRAPYTNWIGRMQEADRAGVERSLELVGMAGCARKTMDRMSDGECQRILIARALAQKAEVLMMDEPTSALDYGNQLRILQMVRRLAAQGYTVILSTHNPQHALTFATTLLALHGGTAAAWGRPAQVLTPELMETLYGVREEIQQTASGPVWRIGNVSMECGKGSLYGGRRRVGRFPRPSGGGAGPLPAPGRPCVRRGLRHGASGAGAGAL